MFMQQYNLVIIDYIYFKNFLYNRFYENCSSNFIFSFFHNSKIYLINSMIYNIIVFNNSSSF